MAYMLSGAAPWSVNTVGLSALHQPETKSPDNDGASQSSPASPLSQSGRPLRLPGPGAPLSSTEGTVALASSDRTKVSLAAAGSPTATATTTTAAAGSSSKPNPNNSANSTTTRALAASASALPAPSSIPAHVNCPFCPPPPPSPAGPHAMPGSALAGSPSSASSPMSSGDRGPPLLVSKHGRKFLREQDLPYPLPVDIKEINRQALRSLMMMQVFGGPFCNPHLDARPPRRVLELGCGAALWTNACHEYFVRRGHKNIAFYGIDVVELAPDLSKRGVNWTFRRHDLRQPRIPFDDNFFDLVFIKDMSLSGPLFGAAGAGGASAPTQLEEPLRVLRPGGVLEVWDSDAVFRALRPSPPRAPGLSDADAAHADAVGTYPIFPGTPFSEVQNKLLQRYNGWVAAALEARGASAAPCAVVGLSFSSEAEAFAEQGSRRVAIPLAAPMRWEDQEVRPNPDPEQGSTPLVQDQAEDEQLAEQDKKLDPEEQPPQSDRPLSQYHLASQPRRLTPEQTALRRTAMLITLQMLEAFAPMLAEATGAHYEEMSKWWAVLATDLLERGGAVNGECLEVGAWWGMKRE